MVELLLAAAVLCLTGMVAVLVLGREFSRRHRRVEDARSSPSRPVGVERGGGASGSAAPDSPGSGEVNGASAATIVVMPHSRAVDIGRKIGERAERRRWINGDAGQDEAS